MKDPEGGDTQSRFDRGDDEGFLARWSRRKQAGYRNQEHPSAAGPQSLPGEPKLDDDPQQATQQRQLTDADMPPVDALDEKSDYAAFMSPGISDPLRAQALRKLFHLPGFHLPDGLDDYDEDFTQFAKLGDIVTHEMKRMLAPETQAADETKTASEPVQEPVVSEADAVQNDVADRMVGNAEDAPNDEDERSEPPGLVSSSQQLNHKGHRGTSG